MKILSVNVNKGGAGKTTLTHNLAEFLASLGDRVLLLDFDDSANLTHRYGHFDQVENTVIHLFDKGTVTPLPLENLDLIAGHSDVEQLKERLNNRRRRETLFGKWLAENNEKLEAAYDYVLIDTENDEGLLTTNAILVSDLVIGIAEASKDSVEALPRLRDFVAELNEDFNTQARVGFVANKINLSEKASKELLLALEKYPEYLGYLPRRTQLADNEPLFQRKKFFQKKKLPVDTELIVQVRALFETIKKELDKETGDEQV